MIKKRRMLIIDGYNLMGANSEIFALSKVSLEDARHVLLSRLSEYHAQSKEEVICVFDAYEVKSGEAISDFHGVQVVFTKEKKTADEYIERFVHDHLHPHLTEITVVTSDMPEQNSIFAQGAFRQTSKEMWERISFAEKNIRSNLSTINEKSPKQKLHLNDATRAKLEKLRRGTK